MRAVVMGGTTGIGRATAERLVTDGAEVIVTGRDEGRLAAIRPGVAEAVALDGTDDNAVAEFFARVGEFDHLVWTLSASTRRMAADLFVVLVKAAPRGRRHDHRRAHR